jgi:histidinol dehydrogenase
MLKVVDTRTQAGRREVARMLAGRKTQPDFATLREILPVVEDVLRRGEPALREYVERFDLPAAHERGPKRTFSSKGERGRSDPAPAERQSELLSFSYPSKQTLVVPQSPVNPQSLVDPRSEKLDRVDEDFARAFRVARRRIESYHRRQVPSGFSFTDRLGVSFEERPVPFDSVGVYVPGGRAFYPSSLLMGVVPARVAGVPRIVVATPARAWYGSAELRWAARELEVDAVLLAGGAHGIAGLVSVAGVAKIVGPGNRWVNAAKHLVSGLVSIDLPAGPSEVAILASADADPALVAADLLAQAEHDPDAKCLLFTDSPRLAAAVGKAIGSQIPTFEDGVSKVMRAALRRGGRVFLFEEISGAASACAAVAAEHVQVMGRRAERLSSSLLGISGAVFVSAETPTAFGDYLAGPNHVLPTGGAARSFSGLSTRDFFRWARSVGFPKAAAEKLAPAAATLARFEGLEGHARSLDLRKR